MELTQTTTKRVAARAAARRLIMAAAGLSLLMSIYLYFLADPMQGLFVGLWVPSILAFGIFLELAGRRLS